MATKRNPAAGNCGARKCSLLGGENGRPENCLSTPLNQGRLRHLAEKIHALRPTALAYFLDELCRGRDLLTAIEDYAALAPYADFVRAFAVRPGPFLIDGGRQ